MLLDTHDTKTAELWREPERRRLVRLCATLTGDREAAEDLAQETLLEAWRNAHKLHDPSGADRWLTAIARNVCLRWARRRGRDLPVTELDVDAAPAAAIDLEIELERTELVELLDRALALLPPETRDVLVRRYVHDSPHAEIAESLGLTEDAVSMRLTRGKVVLRRLLESELADDAAAHGLVDPADSAWQETRIWCTECGRHKLLIRRNGSPGAVSFRCPRCQPETSHLASDFRLDNPVFARLVGDVVRPASILKRVGEWTSQYFVGGKAACTWCGRWMLLQPHLRVDVRGERAHRHGLAGVCAGCGHGTWSSIAGLALARPEVKAFRREHARVSGSPTREVDAGGTPALVVRYENALGSASIDVLFARETLEVLRVHTSSN